MLGEGAETRMAQSCPLGKQTSQWAGESRLSLKESLVPGRAEPLPEEPFRDGGTEGTPNQRESEP